MREMHKKGMKKVHGHRPYPGSYKTAENDSSSSAGNVPPVTAATTLRGGVDNRLNNVDCNRVKVECVQQSLIQQVRGKHRWSIQLTYLSVGIDLKASNRSVKGRNLGNVVILPLTLLFLELKGDTTDGALLDALHQVGGEARDFVA
jgi:hypothetical protein